MKCSECLDEGNVGDSSKCLECSLFYPIPDGLYNCKRDCELNSFMEDSNGAFSCQPCDSTC